MDASGGCCFFSSRVHVWRRPRAQRFIWCCSRWRAGGSENGRGCARLGFPFRFLPPLGIGRQSVSLSIADSCGKTQAQSGEGLHFGPIQLLQHLPSTKRNSKGAAIVSLSCWRLSECATFGLSGFRDDENVSVKSSEFV